MRYLLPATQDITINITRHDSCASLLSPEVIKKQSLLFSIQLSFPSEPSTAKSTNFPTQYCWLESKAFQYTYRSCSPVFKMIGKLAAGIVAFSIVALLTLPAVCALLQQLRHLKNRSTVHSDKDGVATETSTVECTAAISKALQLGLSTLGLGTATALAVSEPTRLRSESSAHWLNSGQWVR